jgi:hypothetical protein
MKDDTAISASAITSAILTVGTIHLGARPGTRTRLGSIIDCRVLSACTRISATDETEKNPDFFRVYPRLLKDKPHNFIDNFT